jgi:putative DNA primase/helicase
LTLAAWAVPIFSANQIPTSGDSSAGYLSRWEVVPFPIDLTKLGIDPSIEKRIVVDELPGVARRAVAGLRQLMARGQFERPATVKAAFTKFEQRIEPLRAWSEERCDLTDAGAWTYRTDLHNDFEVWAIANGYRSVSAGKFYERLELMNLREHKHKNMRGFTGIRLRTPSQPGLPAPSELVIPTAPDDVEYS